MRQNRKRTVFLLAVLLAFVLLSSVVCVSLLSDHDCQGEDCSVCYFIGLCNSFLRCFGFACICCFACGACICLRDSCLYATAKEVFSSPVTNKVKLSF